MNCGACEKPSYLELFPKHWHGWATLSSPQLSLCNSALWGYFLSSALLSPKECHVIRSVAEDMVKALEKALDPLLSCFLRWYGFCEGMSLRGSPHQELHT